MAQPFASLVLSLRLGEKHQLFAQKAQRIGLGFETLSNDFMLPSIRRRERAQFRLVCLDCIRLRGRR